MAGAALGAPQSHFAWQVQHSEHLSVILRGRCSPRSTSRKVRGSPATIEYYGPAAFARHGAALGAPQSHFAGAALGASQCHFAWQVPPSEHLQRGPRKSGDDLSTMGAGCFCEAWCSTWSISVSFCVAGAALGASQSFCVAGAALRAPPERSAEVQRRLKYYGRRLFLRGRCSILEHLSLILRGKCSTRSISVSFFRGRSSSWSTSRRGPRKSGDD